MSWRDTVTQKCCICGFSIIAGLQDHSNNIILEHLHLHMRKCDTRLAVTPQAHPTFSRRKALVYIMTLWIGLFRVFHASGIMKWAALSNCVFHFAQCFQGSPTLKQACLSLHSTLVLSRISLMLCHIWFIIQQLVDCWSYSYLVTTIIN